MILASPAPAACGPNCNPIRMPLYTGAFAI
jgi:hypothetical protein